MPEGIEVLSILSLRESKKERPSNSAAELGRAKHELAFELPGSAWFQEATSFDGFNLCNDLLFASLLDLEDELLKVVGNSEDVYFRAEAKLAFVEQSSEPVCTDFAHSKADRAVESGSQPNLSS